MIPADSYCCTVSIVVVNITLRLFDVCSVNYAFAVCCRIVVVIIMWWLFGADVNLLSGQSHTAAVEHLCGPVRRHLLGAQPGGSGATFSPGVRDVPLAAVADACGLLRVPGVTVEVGVEAEGGLAVENARLRAENAALRAAAAARL